MGIRTEYAFTLPKGYVDQNGVLHRDGKMRQATAAYEILPLKDVRTQQNPVNAKAVVLSRVITKLGNLSSITPEIIQGLYAEDLNYLQAFYNKINDKKQSKIKSACPTCKHSFEIEKNDDGQ
jgi:hypothetical protein